MSQPTEHVYSMTDYYDGPRGGIANYCELPHVYRTLWADIDRNRPDVFELIPIDGQTLTLALEDWAIWRRWEAAFHRGETSQDTHPALPEDRLRHEELTALLHRLLPDRSSTAITAIADFDWPPPGSPLWGGGAPVGVRWTVVDRPMDCVTVDWP
jgi:hypothetical protein